MSVPLAVRPRGSSLLTLYRWTAFPGGLALAAAASTVMHAVLAPPMLVQVGLLVTVVAMVIAAERWLPFDRRWYQTSPRELRTDAASAFTVLTIVNPLLSLGVMPLLLSAAVVLFQPVGGVSLFPKDWPVPAQVLLAAAIAELGQYWLHRWAHSSASLWTVHRFHHSPPRLYWLNGFRVHPLNLAWHQLAGVFVLMVIGVPATVVQSVIAFGTVVAVFQHANADLRYEGWNVLLGTADLHRWHHAADAKVAQCNFGTVLMVWDHVFGTYRPGAGAPAAVGVEGSDSDSLDYLSALRLASAPLVREAARA